MRLINVVTARLESFTSKVPRYAILSHTWGPDGDEVTFQEMLVEPEHRPPRTTSKRGYEKILKTCEIAKNYHKRSVEEGRFYNDRLYFEQVSIEHVWIDTCCIDKSSSAELSKAINSMYNYYREADVCFAYLSDMTTDPETFEKSRWFTRGWTLQELIAPKQLDFYDGIWAYRGNRVSFQETITRITHISTFKNVLDLPVAVRMSWASKRETTRSEDLAYCLMGLFDVNMPLLYGEGNKAFVRLQEEIIKQNPDLSIFAWTDPFPSMFSGLLAKSPEWFSESHDLEAAASINTVYREFYVTNQGIRFQFPLKFHYPSGCLVLPLGHQSQSKGNRVGVFLRQTGNDFCVRASPDALADEDACRRAGEAIIQVSKVLSPKDVHDVRHNGIIFPEAYDRLRSKGLQMGVVAPYGCWDPNTRMVHAGHKGAFECLMIFEMDKPCRAWNKRMGPSWNSFGVIFKYEERRESDRRWLYKVVDTDNATFFEKGPRYILDYFRHHTDFVEGLKDDLTVPGGMYVEGQMEMQQLSIRLVPWDHSMGAQISNSRRLGLEFQWRAAREHFEWTASQERSCYC